ncbi:MAG: hypothetical protein V2A77_12075 [Pseudomonadota bacterium]
MKKLLTATLLSALLVALAPAARASGVEGGRGEGMAIRPSTSQPLPSGVVFSPSEGRQPSVGSCQAPVESYRPPEYSSCPLGYYNNQPDRVWVSGHWEERVESNLPPGYSSCPPGYYIDQPDRVWVSGHWE